MKSFCQKYGHQIAGTISGLDRVVFRGTTRQLAHCEGLQCYLDVKGVLLKQFARHAEALSDRLKDAIRVAAEKVDRPVEYLASPKDNKEDLAREIAKRDGVTEGTIAVLTAVEPCQSFTVFRSRSEKSITLRSGVRKCLHLYRYFIDPELGFGHARIQSWFYDTSRAALCGSRRPWRTRRASRPSRPRKATKAHPRLGGR